MTVLLPKAAQYPVVSYLNLDAKSASKRLLNCCKNASETKCEIDVRIGIFFDGTNNNLARDREGVKIVSSDQPGVPYQKVERPLLPSEYSHSNVARLFLAYQNDVPLGRFSYYIPGVGTPFDEIGEPTETSKEKAFGKGGQARIIFALFQVLNSVHIALTGDLLNDEVSAGNQAQNYDHIVSQYEDDQGNVSELVTFFSKHLNGLQQAIMANPKPAIMIWCAIESKTLNFRFRENVLATIKLRQKK